MATLEIRPRDPSEARQTSVKITLVDADEAQVTGYVAASGAAVVSQYRGFTDTSGTLDVDLTPNADITPANTGYLVDLEGRRILISKSSSTQTLGAAVVGDLDDLGPLTPGTIDGGTL